MDLERVVVRMTADATQYLQMFDVVEARLVAFSGFLVEEMLRSSMKLAMEFERMGIAFEVMTGSAEKGQKILQSIVDLAVTTPFTSQELVKSAKQAMAFGFEINDIIPVLSRLGDVSVSTGTDMDRLILALGQVRTTGRLMGQELRQFTNAGVPILQYLARAMKVSEGAVPQLVRMGRVSFTDVATAFNMMTSAGGRFFGMMERTNLETVFGRWQNFTEMLQVASRKLGEEIFRAFNVRDLLTDWSAMLSNLPLDKIRGGMELIRDVMVSAWNIGKAVAGAIQEWAAQNPGLARVAVTVGAVAAALVVAAGVLQIMIVFGNLFLALLGPMVAVITTVVGAVWAAGSAILGLIGAFPLVAAVALAAAVYITGLFMTTDKGAQRVAGVLKDVALGIADFFVGVFSGVASVVTGFLVGVVEQAGRTLGRLFDFAVGLKDIFGAGFGGALDAFSIGEMDLGFKLLLETVRFGFKALWEWVKLEWSLMWTEVGLSMLAGLKKTWHDFIAFAARSGGAIARSLGITGGPTNERINADRDRWNAAVDVELQRQLAEASATGRTRLEELIRTMRDMPEVAEIRAQAREAAWLKAIGPELAGTMKDLQRMAMEGLLGEFGAERPAFGASALAGVLPAGAVEAQFQALHRQLFTTLQTANDAFTQFQAGQIGAQEWNQILTAARTANTEFNRFRDVLDGTAGAARRLAEAIGTVMDISADTRQYILELSKDFAKGVTPMDQFERQMRMLEEAATGPWRTTDRAAAAMAGLGVPGFTGNPKFGPAAADEVIAFGDFKAFQALQRAVPNPQNSRAPTAMEGSREAAEIIQRGQTRTLTVQEQIAATLAAANELHRQQADYQRQVAEGMAEFRRQGGAVVPLAPR